MPKGYSEDLRWRAVWLSIIRSMDCSEIAEILFMCKKSVKRYLDLFHRTGSVTAKKPSGGYMRTLDEFEQFTVLQALVHHPTMYLHELQDHLNEVTGVYTSLSTICRTIKQHGFMRKKIETIALQRSESKRIEYMAEICMYNPDMFIWIDETGSDRRKEIRKYGYSLRGIPIN